MIGKYKENSDTIKGKLFLHKECYSKWQYSRYGLIEIMVLNSLWF